MHRVISSKNKLIVSLTREIRIYDENCNITEILELNGDTITPYIFEEEIYIVNETKNEIISLKGTMKFEGKVFPAKNKKFFNINNGNISLIDIKEL